MSTISVGSTNVGFTLAWVLEIQRYFSDHFIQLPVQVFLTGIIANLLSLCEREYIFWNFYQTMRFSIDAHLHQTPPKRVPK